MNKEDNHKEKFKQALISTIKECCGVFCPDQDCEDELILIDFINNSQTSLLDSLYGGNINSTPQIKDIDNDGFLDIIFTTSNNASKPFVIMEASYVTW